MRVERYLRPRLDKSSLERCVFCSIHERSSDIIGPHWGTYGIYGHSTSVAFSDVFREDLAVGCSTWQEDIKGVLRDARGAEACGVFLSLDGFAKKHDGDGGISGKPGLEM